MFSRHGIDEAGVSSVMDLAMKMVSAYKSVNDGLTKAKSSVSNVVKAIGDGKQDFSNAYKQGAQTKKSIEGEISNAQESARTIENAIQSKINEVKKRIDWWNTLAHNCGTALLEADRKTGDINNMSIFGSNKKIEEMNEIRFNIDGNVVTLV